MDSNAIKKIEALKSSLTLEINKLDYEETSNQEDVFPSTVGVSFTSSWWRFKNKEEIKSNLIKIIENF